MHFHQKHPNSKFEFRLWSNKVRVFLVIIAHFPSLFRRWLLAFHSNWLKSGTFFFLIFSTSNFQVTIMLQSNRPINSPLNCFNSSSSKQTPPLINLFGLLFVPPCVLLVREKRWKWSSLLLIFLFLRFSSCSSMSQWPVLETMMSWSWEQNLMGKLIQPNISWEHGLLHAALPNQQQFLCQEEDTW